MKRIVLLLISMLLILTGCSTNALDDDKEEVNEESFSIIYNKRAVDPGFEDYIARKSREYFQKTGIKVEMIGIDNLTMQEYNTKLNSKLLLENGPTLLLENKYNYNYWIDKPFVNPNKIRNYRYVYDALKSDKFIPITAYIGSQTINVKNTQQYGYDYKNLDAKTYYKMKKELLKGKKRDLDYIEFKELYDILSDDVVLMDKNGFLDISNDSVIGLIENMKKEILSDTYILPTLDNYEEIEEFFLYPKKEDRGDAAKRRAKKSDYLMPAIRSYNGLDMRRLSEYTNDPETKFIASFLKNGESNYNGFLINPNGKNKDYAIDFIHDLLSITTQTELFEFNGYYATVVNNLEERKVYFYTRYSIAEGSTEVTNETYKRLNEGYYKVFYKKPIIDMDFKGLILKYVFSDEEYNDIEEVKKALKDYEDKYNFYH